MTALIRRSIDGEVLGPGEMIRVIGRTHPLNGGRIDRLALAGSSITEILALALSDHPDLRLRRDFIVHLDGHPIPEKNWRRVRVKKGGTVTFVPRLQNSGVLRSVLSVVVAVAAIIVAGPLGGAFAATAFGAAIGISAATATALIAGGIILAGTLALNALFPVRPAAVPEGVNATALNSIQGARNQANPFGPIPVVLGRHRQSPVYAAKPYTEIVGDDQYLRLLFCLGYGPLVIEDIRIGETPIAQFSDYEIQIRQGFVGDAATSLYPGSVDETSLSITLENFGDGGGVDGTAGVIHTQSTAAETDEISLDFTATEGMFYANPQSRTGSPEPWSVRIDIWVQIHSAGAFVPAGQVEFTRSVSPTRRGFVYAVARGQHQVRVRRATGWGGEFVRDTVVWSALRSIKHAAPIAFPKPLALIALRIKGTDQLSGVIDTLNCVTTSLVKAWNGAAWVVDAGSQWPSDLFRHVLQGPANARPVPDEQIDLENLQEWRTFCVANNFRFNQVRSGVTSVSDALDDIAAAGRAVKTFIDGKWGVIWDRPADSIVQHFTPRNSWGFQLQRAYAQQPHGWRVPFINEVNGFTSDERIVYDDGYDASNATLFEGLQFPGVTDPEGIWKHGRFHIAQSRLRPEKISLSVGWEHLVCTRGDRVHVTHDVPLIGLASGRVKSVAGQVVTLDQQVTVENGKTYGVRFRVPEGARSFNRALSATVAGDYLEIELVGDLSLVRAGTLFGFGETDLESAVYRVQGISHQKDLIATLTLVDDAPEISLADQGEIPEYDPHVTVPPDPFTLPPRDLRYQEVIDGQGASVRALMRLIWQVPRFGHIASFEVQRRDDDVGGSWVTVESVPVPRTSADVPLVAAGVWSFRVRCVFSDGTVSAWASLIGLTLSGLTSAPADVINLHFRSVDGQTVLDWTPVIDQRILNYEVRKGTGWDTGLVVGDAVVQPPWPATGDGTYHVRAYIVSPFGLRIYSAATASISIAGSIIARNIILSKDEQADGWTGALDGGVVDGSFIRTDIGETIGDALATEIVAQLELDGLHIAVYVSGSVVDIGRAAECRFWTEYEASGVAQGADFLGTSDFMAEVDVLGAAPTRFIRAFPIWRFASAGEIDAFAAADVFAAPDVFSAGAEWGDWVAIPQGTRVARFYQTGYVLITDQENIDAVGTKFRWFVDVPDRTDDYTDLAVPDTGLALTFYAGGYDATETPGAVPTPFNGGPNGALVPHVQRAIVDGSNGDEVKITDLTLIGCTVHVVNAGSNVTRTGVNLLVRGY